MSGKVYLVGAGPGDPDLLTRKAHRVLTEADIVLHDALVSDEVLGCARHSARIEDVGKRCGRKSITQEEIGFRMVTYAREGLLVVRLKGGDPLIFGRANEEMEVLHRSGVDFEIVPGITSALSAAAAARISLTDRRRASTLILVSNHRCSESAFVDLKNMGPWNATLVVYMPGSDYRGLAEQMMAAGLDSHTPCMVVSCATRARESVHRTDLVGLMNAAVQSAPAIVIVGRVAGVDNGSRDECISSLTLDPHAQTARR